MKEGFQISDLVDGLVGSDGSMIEDDNPVAHLSHFLHDMCRKDDGHWLLVVGRWIFRKIANEGTDLDELVGVESCGWLIEDDELGIAQECLRQSDALPIALAEFTDMLMAFRRESDAIYEIGDRSADRPFH